MVFIIVLFVYFIVAGAVGSITYALLGEEPFESAVGMMTGLFWPVTGPVLLGHFIAKKLMRK